MKSSRIHHRTRRSRRGTAAVMALMFMAVGTTMALGIYSTAQMNVQSSASHADSVRAQAVVREPVRDEVTVVRRRSQTVEY